jgi:hypothetical protein
MNCSASGLPDVACDVNRGEVRDQRPARQKPNALPLSYRGSSPFCARYATFSSEVLGTQARKYKKNTLKTHKAVGG